MVRFAQIKKKKKKKKIQEKIYFKTEKENLS